MLFTILFFSDSFVNIVSITFTALIFIELLNVLTEVNRLKFKMIVSILGTVVIYIGSIAFLRQYFDVTYITVEFILKVLVITTICWLPLHLLKKIIEKCDPSEEAKVKKS
jgi:phospholipid-translocating ATPase